MSDILERLQSPRTSQGGLWPYPNLHDEAADEITSLREEIETLKSEESCNDVLLEYAQAENKRLHEENARLLEAVGLMTTMAPFMEIDVNDPVGMAKTVCAEQEKLFHENARLRGEVDDLRATLRNCLTDANFMRAAAAAIRDGEKNEN